MIFTIILSIYLISSTGFTAELSQEQVRSEALENIRNYMNLTVDPCENFFQYACGNWINYNKLTKERPVLNGHFKLGKDIIGEIKQIMEQQTPVFNAEVELKVKEFYKSCLNTDIIQKKGYEPIMKFIKSVGGMPLFDKEWKEADFDWLAVESILQSYGFDGLLRVKVYSSPIVESDIFIGEIGLPFPKDSPKSIFDEYSQEMVKILVEKFSVGVVEAEKAAAEIIEFQMKLYKGVADQATQQNPQKYLINENLEELQKKYPTVDWKKFLSLHFGVQIESTQKITEVSPEYIGNILSVIKETPKTVVANFMMWNAVQQFLNSTVNDKQSVDRIPYCIRKVEQYFPQQLGIIYSHKYFDSDIKNEIENMFELIKKEFHLAFEKYDWVDDETKKLAYQRLDNMKLELIGYPKDVKSIDDGFFNVATNPDEYFGNILKMLQYNFRVYVKNIFSKTKIDAFEIDPFSIQAYYTLFQNKIKISLGFLKAPFYSKALPKNMKFAQIGAIIMHELTHGFDNSGQHVDFQGNNKVWWSQKSTETFENKMKCFLDQYAPYQTAANPDISDNIADNGGIKYAYLTYAKWADDIKEKEKNVYDLETFQGFDFTNTQLFFITHAQTWCHAALKDDSNDVIYPVEYRINTPMKNFDEFSKQFKCPEGTAMNPKDKCLLW